MQEFEMMQQIFQEIDTDGSGFIEYKELDNFIKTLYQAMGQPQPTEKQIKQTFKLLDENKDGKISFQEISDMLESILKIVYGQFDDDYNQMMY